MHECQHEDDFKLFREESREAYKNIAVMTDQVTNPDTGLVKMLDKHQER